MAVRFRIGLFPYIRLRDYSSNWYSSCCSFPDGVLGCTTLPETLVMPYHGDQEFYTSLQELLVDCHNARYLSLTFFRYGQPFLYTSSMLRHTDPFDGTIPPDC